MNGELPQGWVLARISDVTEPVPNTKPEDHPGRTFSYVDISSIDNSTFTITELKQFKGKDAPSRARRPIRANDVLFSNVRTYLRNVALVPEGLKADLCSTGFTVLRPNAAVMPRYLFRYVLSEEFVDCVTPQQTGTHYPATSDRVVVGEDIPLPPMAEQRRIVAKLETLVLKVGSSRERLKKVANILRRFRQSALAAACSGRLTADWREQHAGEPWEQVTLKDVIEGKPQNGYSAKPVKYETRYRVLTLTATTSGKFDPRHFKFFDEPIPKNSSLWLQPGDILVQRGNTSEYVGVPAIYDGPPKGFVYPDLMIRFRANRLVTTKFLYLALSWERTRNYLRQRAGGTAGSMPKINQEIVLATPVPRPPLSEQHEIVRRAEALLTLADRIEGRLAVAQAQVGKLTPSFLTKAFRGELVPAEAELAQREGRDYETASSLLERVHRGDANGNDPIRSVASGQGVRVTTASRKIREQVRQRAGRRRAARA